MTGLAMMLKAMGVKIEDEHIRMVEALIPQVPEKINQAVGVINALVQNTHARLSVLETRIGMLEEIFTSKIATLEENQKALLADNAQILETLQNGGHKHNGASGSGTRTATNGRSK